MAPGYGVFSRLVEDLSFEPFAITHLVDLKQRYNLDLDPQFPFAMQLYRYESVLPPYPLNWHERLELFVPVAGEGIFVMGDRKVPFAAGDVLVIDNLKLHGALEFNGSIRRAMVVTFLPAFVCTLGSPRCDSLFLTPFYWQPADQLPAVRAGDRIASSLHNALARLAHCYFAPSQGIHFQAGCKAFLLEVLYMLAAHFGWSEHTHAEHRRRQEQSKLLGKLHDFLLAHFPEKVSVADAASIVHMSESAFMKYFRRVTGGTFVSYLTDLRLEKAAKLLEDTDMPIAEVASAVGFADQSYFDRTFRRRFSHTPREVRKTSLAAVEHCPIWREQISRALSNDNHAGLSEYSRGSF